jgi:hypothetical protein
MIGGRGIRPTEAVDRFRIVSVTEAPLARHPGRRVRVCWFAPADDAQPITFDPLGWPTALGDAPPAFAEAIRRADAAEASGARAPSWPPVGDSPLSLADLPKRMPSGRAIEAMTAAWPRIAAGDRDAVRRELLRRGWSAEEFRRCGIDPS